MVLERRVRISKALAIAAVCLLILSTYQTHAPKMGFFGILNGLPITYYAGVCSILAAGIVAWLSRSNDKYLMWIETIILLFALRVIPSIDSTSVIANSVQSPWYQYGMTIYVAQTGRIDNTIFGFFFSNPGSYLVEASLSLLTGVKLSHPDFLLNNYELFIDFIILVCAYFAINRIWKIPVYQSWVVLWLFTTGMYVGIESTPDVSLSYIMFLVALGLIVRSESRGSLPLIVILAAGIAVTNTLASVIIFFLLISFGLGKSRKLLAIGFVVMISSVSWLAYAATPALSSLASGLVGNYFNFILSLFSRSFSQRVSFGSEAHILNYELEVFSVLSLIVIATLAVSYFLYKQRRIEMPFKTLILMAIADVVFFLLTSGVYHAELPIRFYVFLMPAVFFAISELVKIRRFMIVAIMCVVILAPVNLIVISGNYENYLSTSDLATFHFIYDQYPPGANLISRFYIAQVNYVPQPADTTFLGDQSFLNFSNGAGSVTDFYQNICSGNPICPGILNGKALDTTRPLIVTVTSFDRNSYNWDNQESLINGVELNLTSAHNFDLVYANPDSVVFVSESYSVR